MLDFLRHNHSGQKILRIEKFNNFDNGSSEKFVLLVPYGMPCWKQQNDERSSSGRIDLLDVDCMLSVTERS